MNLEALIDELQKAGQIKPSRLTKIKMSARYYAKALGCHNLEECSESVFAIDKLARNQKIEKFLSEKSHNTIRKTKTDISFLLRQGESLKLISPVSKKSSLLSEKSFGRRKITHKLPLLISPEEASYNKDPYSLPLKHWDENLHSQYNEWLSWVTMPNNKIGDIDPYNRPATIETKTNRMEAFFGFLKNIKGILNLDFEMMIDIPTVGGDSENENITKYREFRNTGLLEEFVRWHINRYDGKFTAQARAVVSVALSIAERFYLLKAIKLNKSESIKKYKLITSKIKELRNYLISTEKPLKRAIPKDSRKISKNDLWQIAVEEFPNDKSVPDQQPGNIKASDAGRALAIMLMLKHPLRNKNLREAIIGQNVIRISDESWIINSTDDEELSEQSYKKRTNTFESFKYEISPEINNFLVKYIDKWHPKLTAQIDLQILEEEDKEKIIELQSQKLYLFLNSKGHPFNGKSFSTWIERAVFRRFGVRTNPELIRQIAFPT